MSGVLWAGAENLGGHRHMGFEMHWNIGSASKP